MKIYKNFFGRKKLFSKLSHVLSIHNTHICAKNQKKLMMKSRENAKKKFSGIFPAFSTGKMCFLKIGLGHILNIIILYQYAKFHEKILSTAREIQEISFRQKSAVPAIIRKFRLEKSVFLTIKQWLMVDIVINNVFV